MKAGVAAAAKKIVLFSVFILLSGLVAGQNGMIDSSVYDKVGPKKNAFFIEAGGASSLVGVYYQRSFPVMIKNKQAFIVRLQAGFSPFTFFTFSSFSNGVSVPMGLGMMFLPRRFKFGFTMMVMHSFYFQDGKYIDYGYTPNKEIATGYKLFLQPQLNLEYHFSAKFVGKLSFTPTLMPEFYQQSLRYRFMPWGGLAFGYKF